RGSSIPTTGCTSTLAMKATLPFGTTSKPHATSVRIPHSLRHPLVVDAASVAVADSSEISHELNELNEFNPFNSFNPWLIPSASRLVIYPFQAAIGTFQRVVNVVVARVAGTRVGLRNRHLIVIMGVVMTEAASAGSAGAFRILLTKPAHHGSTP